MLSTKLIVALILIIKLEQSLKCVLSSYKDSERSRFKYMTS